MNGWVDLSRQTQVNNWLRVATEVLAIPAVSWYSQPSDPTRCKQLAQGCYVVVERPGVELMTSRVTSQCHNHYTARTH